MNKKIIIIIVLVVFLGATIYFIQAKNKVTLDTALIENTSETAKNNPAVTQKLNTVDCGKKYSVESMIIDNVDVAKRIIDLKSVSGECELNIAGDVVGIAQKTDASQKIYIVVLYDKNNMEQVADPFNQSVEIYQIDLNKNELSFQNQFDGAFNVIGSWK